MIEQVTSGVVSKSGDGGFFLRGFRKVYPSTLYSDAEIMKWLYGLILKQAKPPGAIGG
jgi:hypothetical protein